MFHLKSPIIVFSLLFLGGCASHLTELPVPRADLTSIKAESKGQSDRRILQAQQWIEKLPELPKGYVALGQALMQRGRETGELDNYNAALNAFEQAVRRSPADSESLHSLAWCWTMFHRFPKAIELAKKALSFDATDPFALGVLVDSYMELGRYDEAADAAQKMVNLRPDLSSLSRAAQVQWVLGDSRRAIFTMNRALRAGGPYSENTAWCETQLGDMYWKTGAVKAAEQAYQRVLDRLPEYRHAQIGMGRVLASAGKWEAALAQFENSTRDPAPIAYVLEYGHALEGQGKKAEAERQFSRIEKLVSEHLEHGIQGDELVLAEYWMSRGIKLDEALKLCEEEVKEHTSWQTYSALGWVLHRHGRHQEALAALKKAQSTGLRDARIWARMGKVYESLGEREKAGQKEAAARSLNPNFDSSMPL